MPNRHNPYLSLANPQMRENGSLCFLTKLESEIGGKEISITMTGDFNLIVDIKDTLITRKFHTRSETHKHPCVEVNSYVVRYHGRILDIMINIWEMISSNRRMVKLIGKFTLHTYLCRNNATLCTLSERLSLLL